MITYLSARRTGPCWHLTASLILLIIVGCSTTDRKGVRGTVTLDDEPLSEGSIAFRPKPGTSGPTAGATIVAGLYSVEDEGGTFVGSFDVQITAARKTGGKVKDMLTGGEVDEYEQYIPAKYNAETELEVEVTEGGPNEFNFELESE